MLSAIVGYVVGSLPLGFALARRGGVDLRRVGSGNVGATNVYRSAGRGLGVLVMLLDVGKGAGGVWLARALVPGGEEVGDAAAGLGAVVGHVYPVWLRLAGGKGVAVACGVFAVLAPLATAVAAAVFALATMLTRYVSLGSVLATVTLPLVEWTRAGEGPIALAAVVAAALILFRHRGNLARLARGTERRLGQRATAHP